MDALKAFGQRLLKAAQNVWNGFKSLPIAKPIIGLLYSRKSMITAAVVAFMVEVFPQVTPVKDALVIVVAQVVTIAVVAVAQSVGIAIEDAAEKSKVVAGG